MAVARQAPTGIRDIVRIRLGDLRSRLLNLSTSNKLLSTKFSDRTRSHVRVVDELPDVLFADLQKELMTFKALPPMEEERADEHNAEFMNLLDDARLTDNTYKRELIALEERGLGEESGDYLAIERSLRDRVRARMNLGRRGTSPRVDLSAHAREHGINPAYDLPRAEKGPRNSRHHDAQIQLLLLPEQMDRTLSRIQDQAHGISQETGIDTLYMAFGFLEWRDAATSDRSHYAPLLLLPVEMKRERRHGQFAFTVAATGDDLQPNIILAEKLKREFALALPTLEQDDRPETYWRHIERDILKHQRDWSLRRWVAIGVFPFARMAMYHDLDPDKWNICDQPLIGQILGGADVPSSGLAVDYDVDDPRIEQLTPILIADADASQNSAVIDAVKGQSIVIKGPPGTGKSQTITNIIGAALHANKTVLFVAEKMAALEVVSNRLSEAGLGDFCLELHSHKANRKEVLESLRKRLALRRSKAPDDVDSERRQLRRAKEMLNRYVEALRRPYGRTGLTVHDVLWRTLEISTTSLPQPVRQLRVRNASEIDGRTLARARELLGSLAAAQEACLADGCGIDTHPWRGVSCSKATPFDLEELCDHAGKWATSMAAVVEELARFRIEFAAPEQLTLAAWQGITEALNDAAELVTSPAHADLLLRLRDSAARSAAEAELAVLERLAMLETTLPGKLDIDAADSQALRAAATSVTRLGLVGVTVGALTAVREEAEEALRRMERAVEALGQIAVRLGWRGALTVADVRLLKDTLARVAATPERVLRLRTRGMRDFGADEILNQAQERARSLRARHEELSSSFAIEHAADPDELRQHADRLQQGGSFRLVSPRWRRARRTYRQLARRHDRADGQTMAIALARVAEHLHECRTFAEDPQLHVLLHGHFRGMSTDFEPALLAAAFVRDIKRQLLAADGFEGQLRAALLRADPDLLVGLAAPSWSSHVDVVHLAAGRSRSEALHTTVRDDLASRLAEIESLERGVAAVSGLSRAVRVDELGELADAVVECRQLRERLAASPFSAALSVDASESLDKRREFLVLCLRAAHIVANLPGELADAIWGAPFRLADATMAARKVADVADQSAVCFEHLAEQAHIRERAFFDGRTCRTVPLMELSARAIGCAESERELRQLTAWLRARAECDDAKLGKLIDTGMAHGLSPYELYPAYVAIVRRSQAREILEADGGALQRLSGNGHARHRRNFQELEHRLLELMRTELRAELLVREVPEGVGYGRVSDYTDRSLVNHETNLKRPRTPLRDLFARAAHALQRLKPCFLMSPQSVAQYLDPNRIHFDLVVIDEASQMKPEEAIGALARAAQSIIVGDEQQLPPTDFFTRALAADIEDEDYSNEKVAEESILGRALSVFRASRDLRWHYRSRHSGLIAFSNRQFYEDRLIVLPSAHEGDERYGVKLVRVEGVYSGGTNPTEAQAMVSAALEHMRTRPADSLGLVAMNQPQRELVREELQRAIDRDPDAGRFLDHWEEAHAGIERLFVKNLENVQGDERDVIMISTVYGPSKSGGPVAQRFGPINGINGHRRLNVLFTRAKKQTVVFSSMDAADIRTDATPHRGVRIFHDYLSFAATGRLDVGRAEPGAVSESPFEEIIVQRIQAIGCEAIPQVGVAGYRVDIGVRHSAWPHGYILGVECDGAMYHSARSVRERDRLRQEVLENLGWRIYRIWSTDWFNDPGGETGKLRRAIIERLRELGVPA